MKSAPWSICKEKGFFKEQGVDVDLIVLTGVAERNSALKSGKLDALAAPVDYFALSAGNGVVATIVMAIDELVGGDGIVARKSIKSFQDLRGKKVAAQKGLPSDFFLRVLLQQNGMEAGDIDYIDMETAQAGAAFLVETSMPLSSGSRGSRGRRNRERPYTGAPPTTIATSLWTAWPSIQLSSGQSPTTCSAS